MRGMPMKFVNFIISCLAFLLLASGAFSQQTASSRASTGDSLQLKDILSRVLANYPTIRKAQEAINMANEKVEMARTAYNPNVDITASYTRIGPVPVFDLPDPIGKIKLYPNDNINGSLNFSQKLYDFGKTKAEVELAQSSQVLSQTGLEMAKQSLSLNTISVYYSLVYLQNAIMIRNQQLKNLNDLVSYTEKKLNTGSATNYELLNTQVRVSDTESAITELESMKAGQMSVMSSLLDTLLSDSSVFSQQFLIPLDTMSEEEMIGKAMTQREEIRAANQRLEQAKMQYNVARASNKPNLGFFAQGGEKNGYVPDINQMKLNYTAGISLNIPIYDGNREKTRVSIAQSGIRDAEYDLDLSKRSVTNEVVRYYRDLQAARDKMKQYRMQVDLAARAYSLAKVNYEAGAITDLDLLTAETSLSNSRLMLLKSKIDYVLGMYKLMASVGDKLYE